MIAVIISAMTHRIILMQCLPCRYHRLLVDSRFLNRGFSCGEGFWIRRKRMIKPAKSYFGQTQFTRTLLSWSLYEFVYRAYMMRFIGMFLYAHNPDSKVHGANVGPTWANRTQVCPMLALWILLSGNGGDLWNHSYLHAGYYDYLERQVRTRDECDRLHIQFCLFTWPTHCDDSMTTAPTSAADLSSGQNWNSHIHVLT